MTRELKFAWGRAAALAGCLAMAALAAPSAVQAITGTQPHSGFQMIDGDFVNGIAGGQNNTFQSGFTATGTTQATALQLPAATMLMEIDTTAASTGVNAPPALPGAEFNLYNNGASTLTVYPTVPNNPVTSAQDTINSATSVTIATHVAMTFFCAKAGVWAAR